MKLLLCRLFIRETSLSLSVFDTRAIYSSLRRDDNLTPCRSSSHEWTDNVQRPKLELSPSLFTVFLSNRVQKFRIVPSNCIQDGHVEERSEESTECYPARRAELWSLSAMVYDMKENIRDIYVNSSRTWWQH